MAKPMKANDPAYSLLLDDFTSEPDLSIYKSTCYICTDPEYAQMGLPLCYACSVCGGHVPADDSICDDCGMDMQTYDELTGMIAWHGNNRECMDFVPGVHGHLNENGFPVLNEITKERMKL